MPPKLNTLWIISKYATPNMYPRHFGLGMELSKRGYDVSLICSVSNSVAPNDVPSFQGLIKRENHEGLKVYWINGPKIDSNGLIRIFTWIWFEIMVILNFFWRRKGPDSILSSSLSLLSVYSGLILSWRYGARFNIEIRDIWPLSLIELSEINPTSLKVRFLSFTEKLGYKKARLIIGTMPNLVAHIQNVAPSEIQKVICVPQGVKTSVFNEESEPLDSHFIEKYLENKPFIIAYTGALNPNNPIDDLIRVSSLLEKSHKDIFFVILGKGENREKYIELTKEQSNISFPPLIKKNQMAAFLEYVTVGYDAFSSEMAHYGLSRNKWIDYMYNQCVIICSFNGFKSMINTAESGSFVSFGDIEALRLEIIRYYKLPSHEIQEMGKRAKSYIIANHDFSVLASKYELGLLKNV